ncbi:twin-arginine translocase subunit TatC [Ekhidna sp.]|uniref:twin-arginine translocase subunit TatC n=1 Tax=Ekhidna sp. TaxID=2608089 RepID=UPI003517037E
MPLDQISDEKEMSFLDHLEELRWHIIRSMIAIVTFAIVAFAAKSFIIDTVILGPSRVDFWSYQKLCELAEVLKTPAICVDDLPFKIQVRTVSGQFMTHIVVSFIAGLILGFPYLFWEIWRFIKPGLRPQERRASRGATFSVSVLFTLGILFGYFVISPISVRFFATYEISSMLQNEWDLSSYINTVTMVVLGCGLLFQLPVIVYFLTKAGIVSSSLMKAYRKHAIIVILILGAIITPPDPFSQILIAMPLMMLYQLGIVIAKRIEKREARQNKER